MTVIITMNVIKQIPHLSFTFDEHTWKLFQEFWEEIIPPKIEIVNNWSCKCPNCNSLDCHKYEDALVCFSCKNKWKIQMFKLTSINGYLTKVKIKDPADKISFHRFIMQDRLNGKSEERLEVHHVNEDKKDNRLSNLQVLTHSQHASIHEDINEDRAFNTFCDKKYGDCWDVPWDARDEFNTWIESKRGY